MAESSLLHGDALTPTNEREEAALEYADRGWKVLPLKPRDKTPYRGNGVHHATTDKGQIHAWFAEEPDINIGIATGELLVLDADSPDAVRTLSGLPPTRTSRTAKGKHFYYASPKQFKNSVKTVLENVDVRSYGGYVVAPPSMHSNGTRYEWEDENTPIAPLTEEMERLLESPQRENDAPKEEADQRIPEGQRNDALTKIAGELVRRGVGAGFSVEDVRVLLQHKNTQLCNPPLARDEVDDIAASIYDAEVKKRPDRSIRLLSRADIENLPEPEFLVGGMLVKNSLAILYGDPSAGKTFLALDMAICVSSGRAWCGREISGAPVVYVCAEGLTGIGRRIKANEFRNGGLATNLYLVGGAIQLHQPTAIDDFISLLREKNVRPGFVVFDTLSRCSVGVDENSAKDMGLVIAGVDRIRKEFEATVLVIHHCAFSEFCRGFSLNFVAAGSGLRGPPATGGCLLLG
jgi:hypothetical protein